MLSKKIWLIIFLFLALFLTIVNISSAALIDDTDWINQQGAEWDGFDPSTGQTLDPNTGLPLPSDASPSNTQPQDNSNINNNQNNANTNQNKLTNNQNTQTNIKGDKQMVEWVKTSSSATTPLGEVFKALFTGNMDAFTEWLFSIESITMIAVFLFLFGLFHFVVTTTIMKKRDKEWPAVLVSLGISFLGMVTAYDFIAGLISGPILIVIILGFVFYIIWGFFRNTKANVHRAGAENERAKAEMIEARKDRKKIQADERLEVIGLKHEEAQVRDLTSMLKETSSINGSVMVKLQNLHDALSKLSAIRDEADRRTKSAALANEVAVIGSLVHKDFNNHVHIRNSLKTLNGLIITEIKEEQDEGKWYAKFIADLKSVHKLSDTDISKYDDSMKEFLGAYYKENRALFSLTETMSELDKKADNLLKEFIDAQKKMTGHLTNADVPSAIQQYSELEGAYQKILALDKELAEYINKARLLENRLKSMEVEKLELLNKLTKAEEVAEATKPSTGQTPNE